MAFLLVAMLIGGGAVSTAGGLKADRVATMLRMLEDHSDAAFELRFRDGLTVRAYSIAGGLAGCAVGRLDLPEGSRVLGLAREDEREQRADDVTMLRAGDRLILVAEDDKVAALDRVFAVEAGAQDDAERKSRQGR